MANHTRVNLKECPWFGIDHFIDAYTDALKLGTGYDLVRYVNPQPGLEWIRRTKVPLVAVQSVMGDMGTIPEEDCETPSEGFDKYPLEKTALYIIGQIRNSTPKDRKSTRLNSSHTDISRMPSSA